MPEKVYCIILGLESVGHVVGMHRKICLTAAATGVGWRSPLGQRRFLLTVARLGKRYQETLFAGEASKTRGNRRGGWNSGIKGRNGNEKRSERKQAYAWLAKVG